MATGVLMPKAGISVESCIITKWLKKPGDLVSVGDILFSYETDKASFECESTAAGTLLEAFYNDGDEVPVLVNVCAVGNAGEDVAALRPAGDAPPQTPSETAPAVTTPSEPTAPTAPVAAATAVPMGELKISPRAKNLAEARSIDARLAAASGPYGRVIERDIRALIASGAAATPAAFGAVVATSPGAYAGGGIGGKVAVSDLVNGPTAVIATPFGGGEAQLLPEYEDVGFTGIRRAISKSMTASLSAIPQLTHNFSFDASAVQTYRAHLKASGEKLGLPNITLGDMVLFAVSRLLLKYPALNAHMLDGNTIRYFRNVHLGFAVDTERGLIVPVIKHANRKSLAQISAEVKALAKQAQEGTIAPDDMTGGTFTVSNLGAFGVESFTPVINPPQTGILGVNNITQRPKESNGQIKLYPAMSVSLTYDHRAIDGAPASRFGKELCDTLETFDLLLAK